MSTIVKETGWIELIGDAETVAQNQWSASVQIPFIAEGQGIDIVGFVLRQEFDSTGGGAAISGTGTLAFFKGNPSLASGTAIGSLSNTQILQVRAYYDIANTIWDSWDAAGATASQIGYVNLGGSEIVLPRMDNSALYAAFLWTHATSMNSAAGDNETLDVKIYYC